MMHSWLGEPTVSLATLCRTQLNVDPLEDRVVLTVQALPEDYYALGATPGQTPTVTVYDAGTGEVAAVIEAYAPDMTAGVEVNLADFNGDGVADIVTAPGEGGAPHVRIFDGVTGVEIATDLGNFFAGDPAAREGADLTTTDFTGDGLDDLFAIVPTEESITYKLFNGATGKQEAAAVGRISSTNDDILAVMALIPTPDTGNENGDNPSQNLIYIYNPYALPEQQPIWDERIREMTPEERTNAVALYTAAPVNVIPVGHHWVPVTVIGGLLDSISEEARQFFAGAYSGPTKDPHGYGTYGGVKHSEYNVFVQEELKQFMKDNGITDKKPMTKEQAHQFSENIRTGTGLSDPTRAAKIKSFNDAIVKDLRRAMPDQSIAAAVARGNSYIEANPKRYKAYITVGAVFFFISIKTASAAETGVKTAAVLDDLAKPGGLYEQLLKAAEAGDLDKVRVLLVGTGSLGEDPLSKNHLFGFFASAFVDADGRVMYFVPGFHDLLEKWIVAYLTQDKYGEPPVEKSSWLPSWWPF